MKDTIIILFTMKIILLFLLKIILYFYSLIVAIVKSVFDFFKYVKEYQVTITAHQIHKTLSENCPFLPLPGTYDRRTSYSQQDDTHKILACVSG